MNAPVVVPVDELEEQFAHEIPCGGDGPMPPAHNVSVTCPGSRAAILRKIGGCCGYDKPWNYKCAECYARWLGRMMNKIYTYGSVQCLYCGTPHTSPETFSRYAPF